MAEVQKMGANQVQCWQCGEAVYKGTKKCPKCGVDSPTADIAKLRKLTPVLFFVGIPVGIVSLIAGSIMLMKGASGAIGGLMDGMMGEGDPSASISSMSSFLSYGMIISVLLIVIGIAGLAVGPIVRLFLAKVDRAKREAGT